MFTRFPRRMLVAVEFNKGFNDQPATVQSLNLYRYPMETRGAFAFRTGFAFGGIDKFGWALELGWISEFSNEYGTPRHAYVVAPNNAKRITVALDSRWKF
jgi:hypothetical protein